MISPIRLLTKPWRRARSASRIASAARASSVGGRASVAPASLTPPARPSAARSRPPRARARAACARSRPPRPRRCARSRCRRATRSSDCRSQSSTPLPRAVSSPTRVPDQLQIGGVDHHGDVAAVVQAPQRPLHDLDDQLRARLERAREDLAGERQRELDGVLPRRPRPPRRAPPRCPASGLVQRARRGGDLGRALLVPGGAALPRSPRRERARGCARPRRAPARAAARPRPGAAARRARAARSRS